MQFSTQRKTLEEGFLLFLLWRSVNHHDSSCFNILELSLKYDLVYFDRDAIKDYIQLFPFIKKKKKCGSFEYVFDKDLAFNTLDFYIFLRYKKFKTVLLRSHGFSNLDFGTHLQNSQKEIEYFSNTILNKYKDIKPEHSNCKSQFSLQEKCLCPVIPYEKIELNRAQKIGLSTKSTVKAQRIKIEDVKIDIHTTNKNTADKSILYAAGWSLKHDEES